MNSQNIQKGQAAINSLIAQCWKDENFKSQFLNNPVATIEEFTGGKFNLPENTVLKVEDQTNESHIYLNIPRKVDISDLQLTDEELEMVSGGDITTAGVLTGIGISLAAAALYDMGGGAFDAIRDFF